MMTFLGCFLSVATIIAAILILSSLYILVRGNWLYGTMIDMIKADNDIFDKLPSDNHLFWKFWIWDINKFLPK